MQQHNRAHRMQGTRKATLMSFLQENRAAAGTRVPVFHPLPSLLCGLFFALCALLPGRLGATPVMVNLSEFAHGITYPSGTFKAGDTVEITIWVGTAADPVQDALGWDLDLYLTSHAQFLAAPPPMNLSTSWIATGTAYETSAYSVSEDRMYHYHCLRTDNSPKNGYGTICKVKLVAIQDDITAQSMVESLGGGLSIENIDEKRSWTDLHDISAASALQAVSPARQSLILYVQGSAYDVKLTNMLGDPVWAVKELYEGTYEADISLLASGVYILSWDSPDKRNSRKIIIQ